MKPGLERKNRLQNFKWVERSEKLGKCAKASEDLGIAVSRQGHSDSETLMPKSRKDTFRLWRGSRLSLTAPLRCFSCQVAARRSEDVASVQGVWGCPGL